MTRNLAIALICHESISTTGPRAKVVRSFMERLISLAKKHQDKSDKIIFDKLRNKEATLKLRNKLVERFKDRSSGFISIYKEGYSKGDNSRLFRLAFVDFKPKEKGRKLRKVKKEKKIEKTGGLGLLDKVRTVGRRGKQEAARQSQIKTDTERAKSRSGI